jgi:hypothetical protein
MKKLTALLFAVVMMFAIVFIGDALSSNGSNSVNAQTVVAKRRHVGVTRRVYRGGKHVGYRVYRGGRWVTVKTIHGTETGLRMTKNATKKTFHKVKRAVY